MINHLVHPTSYFIHPNTVGVPPAQLAPQGIFGPMFNTFAPIAGGAIGSLFGQSNTGAQIGQAVGSIGSLLPFSAGPQLAPQGIVGDIFGRLAPTVGGVVGSLAGHPNAGSQFGGMLGNLSQLLPFSAGPQLAPQGFFDTFGAVAPALGGAIGGMFGNPNAGTQIGTAFGGLTSLIPYSAGPQFAPQGVLGELASHAGSALSSVVHSPIAAAIAHAAPGIAKNAGYHTVGSVLSVLSSQLGNHPVGAALSQLAPLLGAKAAEVFGQPALAAVGSVAGQGAALLPFSASPSFIQARY